MEDKDFTKKLPQLKQQVKMKTMLKDHRNQSNFESSVHAFLTQLDVEEETEKLNIFKPRINEKAENPYITTINKPEDLNNIQPSKSLGNLNNKSSENIQPVTRLGKLKHEIKDLLVELSSK